jgi:hypothetical protein
MSSRRPRRCLYCGEPAGSKEHIIATRFTEVLGEDPRGLTVPIVLTVTTDSGTHRTTGRKDRGRPTLDYTTKVCARCNNEWMNDLDSAAFPPVAEMIRGNSVLLNSASQAAIAAWACKVAVTARSEPKSSLPIEAEWTDWLFTNHSAIPTWHVWIGHYLGTAPFWYVPCDIST